MESMISKYPLTWLLVISMLLGLTAIPAVAQQIDISRIEMMPNLPRPYQMRDWKQAAVDYDHFVFDFNISGDYLPLIWWMTNRVNYPEHTSFGLHTVVGAKSPGSSEAINVLPAVISASLVGIDKRSQNGYNWVLMCEEYFNRANGANVYLNHPDGSGWDDWWYDTMPNIFFYQLYDMFRGTGDFHNQFTAVADRWLSAIKAMGGSATPWKVPNMNYRAFNLQTMTPLASGVREPEAAGAIAWLLYNAWEETGLIEYRRGAEWAMEFLNSRTTNPSYELQLPYGALIAARMNAELGTAYDIPKLVDWCFTTAGNVRSWGAIVGNWGGYDCSGLIGEVSSNDYGFTMNTFEQAGALLPLVRYDARFARAIGKWILNAANAARLLYPKYLPDQNQDGELWANQYDTLSVIAYEAIHKYDPHNPAVSPFATGDAVAGGWGYTNLSLYGGSHLGIFGGIIDTTDVEGILKLDLLKTDYFHKPAYPTWLIFNPYAADTMFTLDTGAGSHDIYDAATHVFLSQNVSGNTAITIPGNSAIMAVITPAGGTVTYNLDRMLVNGVVVDYHSGQFSGNYPPRIKALAAASNPVVAGQNTVVYCTTDDPENAPLSCQWSAEAGSISGDSAQVTWTAPQTPGTYMVVVMVQDDAGGQDTASIEIQVVEFINHPPLISEMNARPGKIDLGATTKLTCTASDSDNDSLSYNWSASAGVLSDSGAAVIWTAPLTAGNYYITCRVSDGRGGEVIDSIGVEVRDFSQTQSGNLVAYYPFNGNALDESGNGHNGTVSGAVLSSDRKNSPGSAYYFDGVNDNIRVANNGSLNFQQAITVNFWMRIDQLYDREAFPISHGSWENRWKISLIPGGLLRWTVKSSSGIKDLDTRKPMEVNVWHNVTVYYDGADFEIYLDGELDNFGSFSGLILSTTNDLTIGQRLPGDTNYNFKGVLDDIRIFDYGLSVAEIKELYDTGTPLHEGSADRIPEAFHLYQNWPNPFNPETHIRFALPLAGRVVLKIYDITGREVATLIDDHYHAGEYTVRWDAGSLSSGVYFYRLTSGTFNDTGKMLLLR